MESRMESVNDKLQKAAAGMSGWCGGCGIRLEYATPKIVGLYVPNDGGPKGLYILCEQCHTAITTNADGYEELLERVEQRMAAHVAIGNTKGSA